MADATLLRHDPRPFPGETLSFQQQALLKTTEHEIEVHIADLMERNAHRFHVGLQKMSLHEFDTSRAIGAGQYCAYIYRDEQGWVFLGIASDKILDDHMYLFLKKMRMQFNRMARVADDWQTVFCSNEFLIAMIPELPIANEDHAAQARRLSDTGQAVNVFADPVPELEEDVDFAQSLCAGDGVRWRGVCEEYFYRCSANLTLTTFCGSHRYLTWYARLVLAVHALAANFFISMEETIGLDLSFGAGQRGVNDYMQRNELHMALETGIGMFVYMYIIKWLMMINVQVNVHRKDSYWKRCCSFLERVAHIPFLIVAVLYVIVALLSISYSFHFYAAGSAFAFCFCCTIGAALCVLLAHRIPSLTDWRCGWHSLRQYCMLWSCCEQCRWSPESMLGMCMNKYAPCCGPEESRSVIQQVDTQCCLLSLPCCAICPTRCFDECCPSDTTADRFVTYIAVGMSFCTFVAGCLWLWIPRELGPDGKPVDNTAFYQDLVYCIKQTGMSQVVMLGTEIVYLHLTMGISMMARCLVGCYEDCQQQEDGLVTTPLNNPTSNSRV